MNQVFSFDEVDHWFFSMPIEKVFCEWRHFGVIPIKHDDVGEHILHYPDDYNKWYRFWLYEPTPEERTNTPWEE